MTSTSQGRAHAGQMAVEMASAEAVDRQPAAAAGAEGHAFAKVLVRKRAEERDKLVRISTGEKGDFVAADPGNLGRLDGIARVVRLRAPRDWDPIANGPDPVRGSLVTPSNVMRYHADRPAFGTTGRLPLLFGAGLDERNQLRVGIHDLFRHYDRQWRGLPFRHYAVLIAFGT